MTDRAERPKGKPFSIRLTEAEKDALRRKAGDTPLGTYVRDAALGKPVSSRAAPLPSVADRDTLAQVLALLGKSHLANNLNQLAKAANTGSLPVTETAEADLRQACTDVAEMRAALLRALGIQKSDDGKPVSRPSGHFAVSARGKRP